jgi:putative colanic acid biosynthesis UDP-glucose lipid carrier transferase
MGVRCRTPELGPSEITAKRDPTHPLKRAFALHRVRPLKRIFDVALAALALVLLLPLMLLVALAIKLNDSGRIISREKCWSVDGRPFQIYRFRTEFLKEELRIIEGVTKLPRFAELGGLLKQTGIDQLPQLLNVAKGEMSLVGLRPGVLDRLGRFEGAISDYAFQRSVKPGITGWAQVNGVEREIERDEDWERQIALDLWYIENWSLILDFKIIWRTCVKRVRTN